MLANVADFLLSDIWNFKDNTLSKASSLIKIKVTFAVCELCRDKKSSSLVSLKGHQGLDTWLYEERNRQSWDYFSVSTLFTAWFLKTGLHRVFSGTAGSYRRRKALCRVFLSAWCGAGKHTAPTVPGGCPNEQIAVVWWCSLDTVRVLVLWFRWSPRADITVSPQGQWMPLG